MKRYIDEDDFRNYDMETLEYFVKKYDSKKSSINKIREAYEFAKKKHVDKDGKPTKRDSGELYITHPVAVANFLAIMRVDVDTICAGLLHDVLEDTETTKEEIEEKFGIDVANIVEGVTKISKQDKEFDASVSGGSTEAEKFQLRVLNWKKLIDSLSYDPRIIIVKLCDRLHNMLTIEHKTRFKQKQKALETLALYVPLANRLGIYKIQQELENASFKALYPLLYKHIADSREVLKEKYMPFLEGMLNEMAGVITDNIKAIGHFSMSEVIGKKKDDLLKRVLFIGPKYSRARIKHVYGIYDALSKLKPDKKQETFEFVRNLNFNEETFDQIHDLRVVKLIMKDEDSCFLTLRYLHKTYKHIDKYLKDYIDNPKYNMYQSIHTTVVKNGKYVQFQLRTIDQEYRDTYGLAWNLYKFQGPNAREKILEEFKRYPAYKILVEIKEGESSIDLTEYQNLISKEILNTKEITVINKETGESMNISDGSTIHDFAYKIAHENGIHLVSATVNDDKYELHYINGIPDADYYPFDRPLKNGDEISVTFNENVICPRPKTGLDQAQPKILSYKRTNNGEE